MTHFEKFVQLHHGVTPLLIGNVWDPVSAKIFEHSGFKAIATSSWAVADSMGYEDGENIPFDLLCQTVKRISKHVNIPFSVDMEAGYGRDIPEIIQNIEKIHNLGVVGINLEDSVNNQLQPVDDFKKTLSSIASHLSRKGMDMFINARTDAFLLKLPLPLSETIKRIKAYENAGANGVFVPYLSDRTDIREIVETTKLPVNVLCAPELPSFRELGELGVRRISMGSAVYRSFTTSFEKTIRTILENQSFKTLFE